MAVEQQLIWHDDGSRVLKMAFRSGDQTSSIQIDYKKRAKK